MKLFEENFKNFKLVMLFSATLEFNAYSEFDSKSSAKRNQIFNFFSNFHDSVQPNRTSYLPE
jgi:hypothetical protein